MTDATVSPAFAIWLMALVSGSSLLCLDWGDTPCVHEIGLSFTTFPLYGGMPAPSLRR
jgi:hypothetical protein